MIQAFQSYITANNLFTKEDKLLVGVSGGKDSMLLLDLLLRVGYVFGVAHVNYQLRGQDSELDEQFVRDFCHQNQCPFYLHKPDIQYIKEEMGASTQMAARTIRYDWFESIRSQYGYQYILTAHHAADSVETVFLQLIRGTGLAGLQGIIPSHGSIRRPLLFATKDDIVAYLHERKLSWREDQSNFKAEYARNKMRLKVFPLLEEINPGFQKNVMRMSGYARGYWKLVHAFMDTFFQENRIINVFGEEVIDREKLHNREEKELILFHWLHEKGFHSTQIEAVAEWIETDKTEATFFHSTTHILVCNRDRLVLRTAESRVYESEHVIIEKDFLPCKVLDISFSVTNTSPSQYVEETLWMSFEDVIWPLRVRQWKNGDKIRPFGMTGRKKVSDILIDMKVPIVEKSRIFVLEDGSGEILWIIGKKQSEKVRIRENTGSLLRVSYKNHPVSTLFE